MRKPCENIGVDVNAMRLLGWYHGLPLPMAGCAAIRNTLGVRVHVWTVDVPRVARTLRRNGVRGIISNDPATIIAALR